MIKQHLIDLLKESKNLLAFSHGVDSTALFFLLIEKKVEFDIAIVDYKVRKESKEEIVAAQKLATRFHKKIYIKEAQAFPSNFEKNARDFRYAFFQDLIKQYHYTTLLTAHQLNDKLEWFFMQLSKGAGVCELKGMAEIEQREHYSLIRPTLSLTKKDLQNYLETIEEPYFIDKSNKDLKMKRNYFRQEFSEPFLEEFQKGVQKSFEYIEKDCDFLLKTYRPKKVQDLFLLKRKDPYLEIKEIELTTKKLGYILSKSQKDEIAKESEVVVGGKIAISKTEEYIFISPFVVPTKMEKKFKEQCRVLKIPQKSRGYIYKKEIDIQQLF